MRELRVGNTEGKNNAKDISDIIAHDEWKQANVDKMAELFTRYRDKNSIQGVTERYMNDIRSYLSSKLPCCKDCCVSPHVLDEIAVYFANRMTVSMSDALIERDQEWKKYERKVLLQYMRDKKEKDK